MMMAATVAFGMSIDKLDGRFVAPLDLPKSLEACCRKTDRAGRDGLSAAARMFHGPGGAAPLGRFVEEQGAMCLGPRKPFVGAEAAPLALSVICRTGRRLGSRHIVDVKANPF